MRTDSRGLPDTCRETYTPVKQEALESIKNIKLTCNDLIAFCHRQIDSNKSGTVKRLFAMAATEFEVGCMQAVKALTSEEWGESPRDLTEPPGEASRSLKR